MTWDGFYEWRTETLEVSGGRWIVFRSRCPHAYAYEASVCPHSHASEASADECATKFIGWAVDSMSSESGLAYELRLLRDAVRAHEYDEALRDAEMRASVVLMEKEKES